MEMAAEKKVNQIIGRPEVKGKLEVLVLVFAQSLFAHDTVAYMVRVS